MNSLKSFFTGFFEGTKKFSSNINVIVNSLLLTIVYFTAVAATSILAKLLRKNFLDIDSSQKKDSYWQNLNLKKENRQKYYQQF